jgi:hypothetical protein
LHICNMLNCFITIQNFKMKAKHTICRSKAGRSALEICLLDVYMEMNVHCSLLMLIRSRSGSGRRCLDLVL